MPPIPTMPILSHHHHHEQHRQQQQQPQQRHHQYNLPPQPAQQRNPPAAAPATCVTPTVSATRVPAAAPSGDAVASRDAAPPDLSGVPVLPAAAVAPGLPVMTGVPGIEIKNESGLSCMFGLESVGMMELGKGQIQLLFCGRKVCSGVAFYSETGVPILPVQFCTTQCLLHVFCSYVYSFRIRAGHTDSTTTGHHQPAGHHSGWSDLSLK